MSRPNSRTSGIVRLTAVTLSLTVLVGIGWGETSPAEDQRERIIATDYSSIQEAIDSARELGILHIYLPAGKYEIAKTLNLTRFHGGILEGAGCYTNGTPRATVVAPIVVAGRPTEHGAGLRGNRRRQSSRIFCFDTQLALMP